MAAEIETQIATLQAVLAAQKRRYRKRSPWFITLGVVWLGAFVADIFLALTRVPSWYQILPFVVLTAVAFARKPLIRARGEQGFEVRWHDRVIGGLWLALVVGMWATVAVASSGMLPARSVLPLLEWWAAIGMIATGMLLGFPWFWRAGVLWFAGGVASFYLPQLWSIIVYPSLILVAFIAPAVWLTLAPQPADD